jgi:sulfate permease, SulP family
MFNPEFTPKLFTLIREGIPKNQLIRDLLAGIIVGIVALPLAIAFAIASGVSPEKGIITAVVAGFIISFLGGSRVQIGGPTGAFIIIVYGIVQEYGIEGLTVATFIAGFMIMFMGFLRFGSLIKYFPYTLIVGFTTGIAVIIFSSQVKDFFGLQIGSLPSDFVGSWKTILLNIHSIDLFAAAIGMFTLLVIILFSKKFSRIPGSLVAIVISTLVVYFLEIPVETVGSRFGAISATLPLPKFYLVDYETSRNLLQPALAIAALGAIESLLSAVVADGMIGGNHRSNMELVAQGGANIFSAMFGGIPATGAIARTVTNIKNGARTPVSGIVHAVTLLIVLVAASPLTAYIPLACLAGVLMVVAYNMSEMKIFFSIFKTSRSDIAVLLATFLVTVFFDLVIAIEIGMGLAAFLFLKRMSETVELGPVFDKYGMGKDDVTFEEELKNIPENTLIYEISGPLFFGAAQRFYDTMTSIGIHQKFLVLRMRHVSMVDATGIKRLKELILLMNSQNTGVVLSGVNNKVKDLLIKSGIDHLAVIAPDIEEALNYIRTGKLTAGNDHAALIPDIPVEGMQENSQ